MFTLARNEGHWRSRAISNIAFGAWTVPGADPTCPAGIASVIQLHRSCTSRWREMPRYALKETDGVSPGPQKPGLRTREAERPIGRRAMRRPMELAQPREGRRREAAGVAVTTCGTASFSYCAYQSPLCSPTEMR